MCVLVTTRGMAECVTAGLTEATPQQPPAVPMTTTLDSIQRTHSCSLDELNAWLRVLEARFASMPDVLTSITHVDVAGVTINTPDSPKQVVKTVLRAFINEHKSLTVTFYLKHKSGTGTLLVQGNGCPEWADEEFPRLEALIPPPLHGGPN